MKFNRNYNLLVIFIIGVLFRVFYLVTVEVIPSDALQFIDVANAIKDGNSYPNGREIGFPIILVMFFPFSDITFSKMRILTVFVGSINILLFYRLNHKLLERWKIEDDNEKIALFATFLYTTSIYVIRFDNSGIREPIVLLMLMIIIPLIYDPESDKRRDAMLFSLYFSVSLVRSEFQFLALFMFVLLIIESKQHGDNYLKAKSFIILIAGLLGMISWMLLSYILIGDASATSNMLVSNIINRNSPGTTPKGLFWFIFEYHGLIHFVFIEIYGTINIILWLQIYLGVIGYITFVFGLVILLRKNNFTMILMFVSGAILNGFNAYEFEYFGTDRILMPYYAFLFVIAGLSIISLDDFALQITPNRIIVIKSQYILFLLGALRLCLTIIRL